MILERRQKHPGQGRTSVKTKKRLNINFDLMSLNLMCNYVLSENRNIKRGQYINLRNLIDMLDMERYINDQEKFKRIKFIKKGLEARLTDGLTDPRIILKYINGGILDNNIIDIEAFVGMSNREIDWINNKVSSSLSFAFIYEEQDYAIDLWTRFKTADYEEAPKIAEEIEQFTATLHTKFRKVKVEKSTDRTFSLKPDDFRSILVDTYNEITSEYRKLVTGMQGFNQLIGGGFENTRLYLFLGLTGIGKSLSLLNIAYQMKKYNKGFKPKDPTKIPCIVYLTMENTVTETIQRLFQICTGEDMRNHTVDEVEQMLKNEGELYLTDNSPIDLLIKYKPNRSEDTSYLYTMTEDLEDEGYEVICLIQDHIKRIRSTTGQQDVRLELGDVSNEMKTFAMLKDIPVITDSHLNREGARTIDSSSTRAKADLTRMLGKSNIGESLLMLDNTDFGCILNVEYDEDGNKYMVFKNIKTRIKILRDYICQPFTVGNEIKLIEDFYSQVPVFKESLYNNASADLLVRQSQTNQNQSKYVTNIKSLDDKDEDNIYEYSNRYSSIQYESMNNSNQSNLVNTLTQNNLLLNNNIEEQEPELVRPVMYA